MSELLKINDLFISISKQKLTAVKGISFSVQKGKSLIILGESGSGKTMTCHSIVGLLDPKKFSVTGEIVYNNTNLLSLPAKEKRRLYGKEIAFIPQNPMTAFDPSMKIGKQMVETLRIHSDKSKRECMADAISALETVGLADAERIYHSFPFELSGGMLQRVTIAMALMVNAKLVIADEPTTALDVVHRNEIIKEFVKMREKGTAVIMVTHDFAAAVQLGGNMLIINNGEIIERGTTEEIFRYPKHDYTAKLIQASVLSAKFGEDRE